ncbi:hypothetical protein MHU86_18734 [Fragilaria crotonensis]|nr:hypothetical protein MHU86_18734 [Fragilaria crotonensis]
MIESVASNNIITFQQDNSTFSGPHFACLAVSTRRSSLLSDPSRTPDPQDEIPAQNDPQTQIFAPNEPQTAIFTHDEHGDEIPAQNDTTSENPTQNTTDSPEIHSQQLISDAETTYDEHAQTTQQLPGTQPNLAFLPPNSPETSSSHTETPQLTSNCEINNWASKTLLRCIFRHSHAEKRKITSQSGRHQLEPTTSDFDNFFDDTQNYTYQKVLTPKFEPPTTKSVAKSFATPKSTQQNYSTSQHEICQTYAKIT